MPYLYNFDPKTEFATLLACDKIDASRGALTDSATVQRIPPNTHNRTILIGLGGTGIKTIDYVKRTIAAKLDPTWTQYIAFLGIDSDSNEIDNSASLDRGSFVNITRPGSDARVHNAAVATTAITSPAAWNSFVSLEPNILTGLPSLATDGCNRMRLIGKMKFHDKESNGTGVDQDIVTKLMTIKGAAFAPFAPGSNGVYEVYVIGSVGGGTCSGGFLEMPALIHKALNAPNVRINAILYLPDATASLDQSHRAEMEANGYAALKELNYFEGLKMRGEGYSDVWPYNDRATPELFLNSTDDFYKIPYLIGTVGGNVVNSDRIAREMIGDFFVSVLGNMAAVNGDGSNGQLVDSFKSNAEIGEDAKNTVDQDGQLEANEEAHEFPKRYAALGFAKAAAPKTVVKAYVAGQACAQAGLKPIDSAERAARLAAANGNVGVIPFRGEDDYMDAKTGTSKAKELIQPLENFVKSLDKQEPIFTTIQGMPEVNFDSIKKGSFDGADVTRRVNDYVEKKTAVAELTNMEHDVNAAFQAFRQNVKDYVSAEGPFAFVNLFEGRFVSVNGDEGVGIKQMINRICFGNDSVTGNPRPVATVDACQARLTACKTAVTKETGLTGLVGNLLTGKREDATNAWKNAFNSLVNARVNSARRERALGPVGYLAKNFEEPAKMLSEQLRCFGHILDRLSGAYADLGGKLADFQKFSQVVDSENEVNIAAITPNVHQWLLNRAQTVATNVQAKKIRDDLVASFFEDSKAWLEIPDDRIVTTSGGTKLSNADYAVPARQMFDQCLQQTIGDTNTDVSIEELFNQAGQSHQQFAEETMQKLLEKSQPLFDGDWKAGRQYSYVMYPSALSSNTSIVTAIRDAAILKFGQDVQLFESGYADSITAFYLSVPFELYRLNGLKQWELQYEDQFRNQNYRRLHGMSPDVTITGNADGTKHYHENESWFNYPAITYNKDPQKPDPATGKICHEGEVRNKIDELIEEAKKQGVLYSERKADGNWYIRRVYCDKTVANWHFNEELMMPDPDTGLLPSGKALIEAVVQQNTSEMTLDRFTKDVLLIHGGVFSKGCTTEEFAWKNAKRVLYAHRPMLAEIRETVERFREWSKKVNEYNAKVMARLKPAKMYRLVQGHVLYQNESGMWVFEKDDGAEIPVANLSESNRTRMKALDPAGAALVEEGLTLYYVFEKLMAHAAGSDASLDSGLARAKDMMRKASEGNARCIEIIDESSVFAENELKKQTAIVEELGLDLDDPEHPRVSVLQKLDDKGINKDTAIAIAEFYGKARLWKRI